MPVKKTNLSEFDPKTLPQLKNSKIGIVVSEWNREVTDALLEGAFQVLQSCAVQKNNIIVKYVPGSFELPLSAQYMIKYCNTDAVICLGSVIQGETRHFEFICQAVANGIIQVGTLYNVPVIFGVLTTDNMQQAVERSGGKHGNKGIEAAIAAIKMIELKNSLKDS